ncbi:MAG: DNA phosphorothioation-dependent restriction protein DptF, partial [Gammaproteobacteria bacterium]|nr:DNA phosphorothioation-dependent restriction protein DptF [Gammaproteobacteria bacterium]
MGLKSALSVLSKSSPYSVSTLRKEGDSDAQQKLKDYLYIKPPIQSEFETALIKAGVDDIICLCGSSGDGKSEILTRLYKKYSCKVDFHLDATHSKSQHQSAVDCLNDEFDKFKSSSKPLAIGINIGMLQKFMKLGDERHNNIKASFGEYFKNRHTKGFKSGNVSFYDFECYPRLEYTNNKITSNFVSKFLQKLTCNSDENPFWQYYLDDVQSSESMINKNFEILSLEAFQ